MTLHSSDTQQLMKAFVPANPIIPANTHLICQPTQATSKRDKISFVANVALVAFVYDVADLSDLKTELALVVTHCDDILEIISELESNLEIAIWGFLGGK